MAENHVYKERFGAEILAHPLEAERLLDVDRTIEPGDVVLETGGLSIGAIHTPGHTDGMLNFVVDGTDVFTGRHPVQGLGRRRQRARIDDVRRPKSSIMDKLMKLDPETRLHPGHTDPTTVGEEWENNAFVRVWRGLDPESDDRCTVWEQGRDARPMGARLRRRPQGVGPLGRVRGATTSSPAPRSCGTRQPDYWLQTGHWPGPERAYRIAARLSCSASEAAAGSPLPPTDCQVPVLNWYLPR